MSIQSEQIKRDTKNFKEVLCVLKERNKFCLSQSETDHFIALHIIGYRHLAFVLHQDHCNDRTKIIFGISQLLRS